MKNEKFCSQLSTYVKRRMGFRSKQGLEEEGFQTVFMAAGETDTTQENIQDYPGLDEGDPDFSF
jgi:hypothetical protein